MTPTEHAAWLASRKRGLGGSDIGAIIDVSRFATPFSVWAEKTGAHVPDVDNESAKWGNLLEEAIAQRWAADNGYVVQRAPCVQHPDHPWWLGTPDYMVYERGTETPIGILEVKCPDFSTMHEWGCDGELAGDSTAPDSYICQLQWYLGATGLKRGWFAVFQGTRKPPLSLPYESDAGLLDVLTKRGEAFWRDHVEADVAPPMDGMPATDAALLAMHSRPTMDVVDGGEEALRFRRALDDAKTKAKEFDAIAKAHEQRLKRLLGDAESLTADGAEVFRWKRMQERPLFVERGEKVVINPALMQTTAAIRKAINKARSKSGDVQRRVYLPKLKEAV